MKILNSFTLKMIGIITMTIDHIGYIIYPNEDLYRIIGRIAFPIFAFLIAQGFTHTKNVYKYLLRLSVFAVLLEGIFFIIKEVANSSSFSSSPFNIFVTLALGLAILIIIEKHKKLIFLIPIIMLFTILTKVDYGLYGVFSIVVMYYFKDYVLLVIYTLFNLGFLWYEKLDLDLFSEYVQSSPYRSYQLYSLLALVFILLYNGKRGYKMKYLFYIYYPLHLGIIYLVGEYIL